MKGCRFVLPTKDSTTFMSLTVGKAGKSSAVGPYITKSYFVIHKSYDLFFSYFTTTIHD